MSRNCRPTCKLCDKLILSTAVNYEAATNSLLIQIPAGSYNDGCKYCIVVAQAIPLTVPIGALVYITIGTGAVRYPVVKRNCAQLTACGLRTRTKYSTCVETNTRSGVFKLLGNTCGEPCNNLTSINGTAPVGIPATPATVAEGGSTNA